METTLRIDPGRNAASKAAKRTLQTSLGAVHRDSRALIVIWNSSSQILSACQCVIQSCALPRRLHVAVATHLAGSGVLCHTCSSPKMLLEIPVFQLTAGEEHLPSSAEIVCGESCGLLSPTVRGR